MHQCASHHRAGTSTWTTASHCFVEPLWLFQCKTLAPRTLSVRPEYQEYSQLLQWKKTGGQGRRTGRLVWDGGENVTVGSKKTTGTTLRADLERSHESMDIKHREWDVQALGTGPGPHKQSLAQDVITCLQWEQGGIQSGRGLEKPMVCLREGRWECECPWEPHQLG